MTNLDDDTAGITCQGSGAGTKFIDTGGYSQEIGDAIACVYKLGITVGTSPTTFSPEEKVTRWQMAIFLARVLDAAGITMSGGSVDPSFTDTSSYSGETKEAIGLLFRLGITVGTGPSTFSPAEKVTRWQMAIFLARVLDAAGSNITGTDTSKFTDTSAYSAETKEAIGRLFRLGITVGTSPTTFSPEEKVTRWQMAIFLARTWDAFQ
jgi:rRNA maturation protein Nop10